MELPGLQTQAVGPALFAHCMRLVCEKSKWNCETHLLLNRQATKRCRAQKKAAAGVDDSIILARVRAG
jgi:hypothetical protein